MNLFRRIGHSLGSFGAVGLVLAQTGSAILRGQMDRKEFGQSLVRLGFHSIPVIFATALFVGGTMVVQAAPLIGRYGAHGLLGWGAGFGILREVGPVLTALMISGRAGSNNTAELGTMTVTEQLDGLRALAIDPAGYLVAPRVLSIVITNVVGTLLAIGIALVGASLAGLGLLGVHPITFWNGLVGGLLSWGDLAHGMMKSLVFGCIIAGVSTSAGLHAVDGAPGVGRAVNKSVVGSALVIFIFDALVSLAERSHP